MSGPSSRSSIAEQRAPLSGEPLPIQVRRAHAGDREGVLGFATGTWEGWDYIPDVFDAWLVAPDGVCLVAIPAPQTNDRPAPLDSDGRALDPARPVAFCRVALLSPTEAWLEGIRVDPAVRGRSVATALQVAELAWAAAQGATVVRYTTSEDNEGSHRLGARHGFKRLADRRSYGGPRRGEDEPGAGTGARADSRRQLLESAAGAGLTLPADVGLEALGRWWERIERDPTFILGDRLYEWRSWAFQELTAERFEAHVRTGAVLTAERPDDSWAVGIVSLDRFLEGEALFLALLVGDAPVAVDLAARFRDACREPVRLRLPDPGPPVLDGIAPSRSPGEFTRHARALHLFGRQLDSLPDPDEPDQLTYLEEPGRVVVPPSLAG